MAMHGAVWRLPGPSASVLREWRSCRAAFKWRRLLFGSKEETVTVRLRARSRLWLLALIVPLAPVGCILGPSGGGAGSGGSVGPKPDLDASGNLKVPSSDPTDFYDASWFDSSGKDGKGGVRMIGKGDMRRLPLRPSDFDHSKLGDEASAKHAGWQLFAGKGSSSLSLEWEWVTKGDDKFWGLRWAGSGVAFNQSW